MRRTLAVFMILAALAAQGVTAAAQESAGAGEPVDPALAALASETHPFMGGGTFVMGTSQAEVQAALDACEDTDGCDEASAADALTEHQASVGPYQIELYEVSAAQYAAFLNTLGPDRHLDGCLGELCALTRTDNPASNIAFDGAQYAAAEGADSLPVTHVSWYGAQAYCEALDRRLPTEAEWELAARGPSRNAYPWGAAFDAARANTARTESAGLAAVDAYPDGASVYGALNMAGNVAEWVLDWYASDFYATEAAAQPDTTGPETGTRRVVRGGSWQDAPFYARSAQRASLEPEAMVETVGFRCAVAGWPAPEPPETDLAVVYEGIEHGTTEDGAPYLGSPDAPVVLTEFFQFTCPHCNSFRATLKELFPYVRDGKVQIIARALPSSSQLSVPPIFVALCALDQDAYWPLHDYFFNGYFGEKGPTIHLLISNFPWTYTPIYSEPEGPIAYLPSRLLARAEVFGLDADTLDACLGDETRTGAIQNTIAQSGTLASEKGVSGVPTVLLNGEYILDEQGQPLSGALALETLQQAIDAALSAAP